MLIPVRNLSDQTVDQFGQQTGQLFQPTQDLQMISIGAAYTFLSEGLFQFRGNLEYAMSIQNPQTELRFLQYQGTINYFLEASGTLKCTSINPGLTVVYVSSGAGEYGLTLEERFMAMEYDINQATYAFPSPGQAPSLSLKKQLVDPFLSVHATFVQQYQSCGLFARISYGLDLRSIPAIGGYQQQDFQTLNDDLLEALRPRQEVKLSLGTRF